MPDEIGKATEATQEIDFGAPTSSVSSPHPTGIYWALMERRFQLSVLILFVLTIGGATLLDIWYMNWFKNDILDAILRAIVPLFTFVLGLGIKVSRD